MFYRVFTIADNKTVTVMNFRDIMHVVDYVSKLNIDAHKADPSSDIMYDFETAKSLWV